MTFVLLIVAIALAIGIWRTRRDMRWWGIVPVIGDHRTGDPWRDHRQDGPQPMARCAAPVGLRGPRVDRGLHRPSLSQRATPRGRPLTALRIANLVIFVVVLVMGALTTGAGPHSGDPDATERLALDPAEIAKAHAGTVWLFLITLGVLVWLIRRDRSERRPRRGAQGVDRCSSSRPCCRESSAIRSTSLACPSCLVELHLVGVATLAAAMSAFCYLARPVTNR